MAFKFGAVRRDSGFRRNSLEFPSDLPPLHLQLEHTFHGFHFSGESWDLALLPEAASQLVLSYLPRTPSTMPPTLHVRVNDPDRLY